MPASDAPLRLRVGARTERGLREENQDQMTGFPSAFGAVYLIADGMGGHRGGAEASRRVADGYRRHLAAMPASMPLHEALQSATTAVNEDLLKQGSSGDQSTRGMGSTVVLVAFRHTVDGPEYVIGHVGDSRAYLLMGTEITKLTRDHSMVQRLVDENLVAVEDARNHPNANVLLRAIGQQPGVVMDISGPHMLHRSARILLCSDGLWGYVPDREILEEAERTRDPEQLASNLVDLALRRGSDDNVTVQILCPDTGRVTSPLDLQPPAGSDSLPADQPAQALAIQNRAVQDSTARNPTNIQDLPSGNHDTLPTEPSADPVQPPASTMAHQRPIHNSARARASTGWLDSSRNVLLLAAIVVGLLASGAYLFLRSRQARPLRTLQAPLVSPLPQQPVPQPSRPDPHLPPDRR